MVPWTRVQGPDPVVHIPRRPHPRPRFVLPSTFQCTVFAERAASFRGRLGKAHGLVKPHDNIAWVPRRVPIRSVRPNIRRTAQQRVSVPAADHHFRIPAGIFCDVAWPSALALNTNRCRARRQESHTEPTATHDSAVFTARAVSGAADEGLLVHGMCPVWTPPTTSAEARA